MEQKLLPTGKPHVSFSEVRIWKECGWKHKLTYIDKLAPFETSVHLEYGTIIHDALEHFLKTRELKIEETKEKIKSAWEEHQFDIEDNISKLTLLAETQGWKYRHNYLSDWLEWSENTLRDITDFMEKNYPEWEFVSAEEKLYEEIKDSTYFKGFIDGIIKYKKGRKDKYVIIDWKTAGPRGWMRDKKQDIKTTAQLTLYKYYWGAKNNISYRDIACHFVLLKRQSKPGKICQIIEVSAGDKSMVKANKMVNNMLSSVRKGMFLKNRNSCKFCPFLNTELCK
tara:strand:+ start:2923 stop:3768 length:846 start_codon:yes stop_codon:yes gene_type:complete